MNTVSTAAAVIPFPKRNKNRVRKTESMRAAGMMSLGFLDIAPPANVVLLDGFRSEEVYAEDTTALLAIALFVTANDEQKASVRTQIDYLTKTAPTSHKRLVATRLSRMLRHS